MSRHSDEHLDLCAEYALGTIDDVSRRRLEEHLRAGCAECEAALRDFGVATTALAASAPAVKASAALRDRVASAARSEPRRTPSRSGGGLRVVTGVLAAASIVFFVSSVVLFTRLQKLTGEQTAMRARLDNVEQQLAQAQSSVAFLTGSGTDCFTFNSTGQGDSTMVARACFSPANGEALVILDHASAPAGKDIELWVLRGNTPASLGLVRADTSGHAVIHMPALANAGAVTAFALSVEETGGSKGAGPQGPVVSVGALKG